MRFSRREFLRYTGLATASMMVPQIIKASGEFNLRVNGRCSVIIQLSGGNDWLNTLPPIDNDLYHRARPKLGLKNSEIIRLNSHQGLHPELKSLRALFDQGHLSILNGVGYPDPVRSHFRSMDIWQTASDSDVNLSTGWVGRTLDELGQTKPFLALELDDSLSLAMKGEKTKGLAISSTEALYRTSQRPMVRALVAHDHEHDHKEVEYLYRTLSEVSTSAQYLHKQNSIYRSSRAYPINAFGRGMKTIAELIVSGCDSMVYYISLGGFDTHSGQALRHQRQLSIYDHAVSALMADLKENNKLNDVAVLTFSEFGRRVEQNASGGTDHGAAGNVLLMGGSLRKPGIVNAAPDLTDLDDGDIRHKVDFRQIYADLIGPWLGQRPEAVLGEGHVPFGLL